MSYDSDGSEDLAMLVDEDERTMKIYLQAKSFFIEI